MGGWVGTSSSFAHVTGGIGGDMWVGQFDSDGSWCWDEVALISTRPLAFATIAPDPVADNTSHILFGIATRKGASIINPAFSDSVYTVSIGCNPGSFSRSLPLSPCRPCAIGQYASQAGLTACSPCPAGLLTPTTGSVFADQCTVCPPDWCGGHGTCTVSADSTPTCVCDFAHKGSVCENQWLFYATLALGLMLFLVLVGVGIYKYQRRRVTRYQQIAADREDEVRVTQQLLHELDRVFEIRFDDVRLVTKIDEGAFGEVWRGEWNERTVAVKLLRACIRDLDEQSSEKFQAEVNLMKRLRHRNIVWFLGAGMLPTNAPFLVTEFMERGSLRRILADKRVELDWERRVSFALDTARGMEFLHSLDPPRIHRDLKSANLLVSDVRIFVVVVVEGLPPPPSERCLALVHRMLRFHLFSARPFYRSSPPLSLLCLHPCPLAGLRCQGGGLWDGSFVHTVYERRGSGA